MEWNLLSYAGAAFLGYYSFTFLLQVIHGVRAFVLPTIGIKKNLKKLGEWAVVTGCTDGIGKAYTHELARQGFKIVLISRTLEKLETLAVELLTYGTETKVISMDFSGGVEIYDGLEEKLAGLNIGILVNNVGVSHYPEFFTHMKREDAWKMINVNILSVIMMTHIILPEMAAKGKGLIINVASAAGLNPTPLLSMYSGTKVFVDFFSRCINTEYSPKGVICQCVLPYYVATKMSRIRKPSVFAPSPTSYVQEALGTVGVESRTVGCWSHALQKLVHLHLLPAWLREIMEWNFFTGRRMVALNNRRNRELKEKTL
ncbi:very-long-chain 3-oxoacyl-CoA reductase-B-like isoform X2 [Acropora muricata]|uniref:very-long-chain 3-oxoacyl-CoA reductase-B-like isoform X2 n=1 Tax=Acropora muricata TaxID=159855 RepID=UPI0034E55EB0